MLTTEYIDGGVRYADSSINGDDVLEIVGDYGSGEIWLVDTVTGEDFDIGTYVRGDDAVTHVDLNGEHKFTLVTEADYEAFARKVLEEGTNCW